MRQSLSRRMLLGHVPVDSPIYGFHPATRLIGFLSLSSLPLFIFMPEASIGMIACMLALLRWAGVGLARLRAFLPVVISVAIFIFGMALIAPQSSTGPLVRVGPADVPFEGILNALASYCRLMAMASVTVAYFSTTREQDLLVGLRSLGVPFAASYVVGLSIRSAALFLEDFRTIRQAERARGLDPKSLHLATQAKLYVMYLIPLFSLAIRRGDEISSALYCRGYSMSGRTADGTIRADYIRKRHSFGRRDLVWSGLLVTGTVAVATAQLQADLLGLSHSPLRAGLRHFFGLTI